MADDGIRSDGKVSSHLKELAFLDSLKLCWIPVNLHRRGWVFIILITVSDNCFVFRLSSVGTGDSPSNYGGHVDMLILTGLHWWHLVSVTSPLQPLCV